MLSSVDYVANNSKNSNASASQSLLASLSALTATSLLPATPAATEAVETVSTASFSRGSSIVRNSQMIAPKGLASSNTKRAGQRCRIQNTLSCQVCGKKYTSLSPSNSLKYHEAVTGHLQSWTKERGVTWDDLKAWAEQKTSRGKLAQKRRRRQAAADKHGQLKQGEGYMDDFSGVGASLATLQSQAIPAHQSRKVLDRTGIAGRVTKVWSPDKPASVSISPFPLSANCEERSGAYYGTIASVMDQHRVDSEHDCAMPPMTKPDGSSDLRLREGQGIPTIQSQDQAKSLQPSSQTVDVIKAKSTRRGAAQSNISPTSLTVTKVALPESADCTKCGRVFSGSRAKAHLSRHRNKVRHCNRYRAQMSVSNPSPAHTRPTKVTSTRPSQRTRKRSTGSLHSSDGASDISEGVWVSAVPANGRPRTPDTTYSASGNNRHRLAIASDPDAVLFPPGILAENDRREKKNKRRRMQDWVSSYSATTEDDASQGTSRREQAASASLDLQSISEPVGDLPEPIMVRHSDASDISDSSRKKRRTARPASPLTIHLDNGRAPYPSFATSSNVDASYWKTDNLDDIATICFKHQARHATPWPTSMSEQHFITLPNKAVVSSITRGPKEHDSDIQSQRQSWISSVTATVWNTLKRSGSRFSPQKTAA